MPGKKELSEEEIKLRVAELKKLVQADEGLKGLQSDDDYLKRFLIGTHFDVEAAYEKMKTFYELLLEFPEWFSKDTPNDKKHIIDQEIRYVIPGEDKEGRPIYVVKFSNVNVNKMDLYDCISVDDIMMEYLFENPNIKNGLSIIMDVSDMPWKLMKWLTPHNIKIGLKKMETFPINHFRFHIVKSSMIVNACIKLVWPFLSSSFKDMIKFHFNDMNSLHQHIDQEVLPVEYGGYKKIEVNKLLQPVFEKNYEIQQRFETRIAPFLVK